MKNFNTLTICGKYCQYRKNHHLEHKELQISVNINFLTTKSIKVFSSLN